MSLYFTEFSGLATLRLDGTINAPEGAMQVASGPIANGSITLTGSNQQSSAFNASTRLVRVVATVASWISFGSNPNASTDTTRIYMAAGTTEYFGVTPAHKIAGITA